MKAYVCDACGKTVRQVIKIDAGLKHTGPNIAKWSAGSIAGDYCQNCADKIILFMRDLKNGADAALYTAIAQQESRRI